MADHKCELLMRQTNYSKQEALDALEKSDGDVLVAIRKYIKGDKETEINSTIKQPDKALNQKIYGEIRELLDNASKNYRLQQELNEKKKAQAEQIQRMVTLIKKQTNIAAVFGEIKTPISYSVSLHDTDQDMIHSTVTEKNIPMPLFSISNCINDLDNQSIVIEPSLNTKIIKQQLSSNSNLKCVIIDTIDEELLCNTIHLIRDENSDLKIGYKGYPEGHPSQIEVIDASASLTSHESNRASYTNENTIQTCRDIKYKKNMKLLQSAQANGVDFILTQSFYDLGVFFQYCTDLSNNNISIPLVPSLSLIDSYDNYDNLISNCKYRIPPGVQATIQKIKQDADKVKKYGMMLIRSLMKSLVLRGVQHIHLDGNLPTDVWVSVIHNTGLRNKQMTPSKSTSRDEELESAQN